MRLTAALTGRHRAGAVGPNKAHELNVLSVTKRIHKRVWQLQQLRRQVEQCRRELRADRRELRAILQRDSSIDTSGADIRLELAGKADAVDAAIAASERKS